MTGSSCRVLFSFLLWVGLSDLAWGEPEGGEGQRYEVGELRDVTGLSLRMWFSYFGNRFPYNIEILEDADAVRQNAPATCVTWPGLVSAAGLRTTTEILEISQRHLGATLVEDLSGAGLVFATNRAQKNPFDTKLSGGIRGAFSLDEALIQLRKVSGIDLSVILKGPNNDLRDHHVSVEIPEGSTLRHAINILAKAVGAHWSALVVCNLQGSHLAASVNPGQNALIFVQMPIVVRP